jgi:hypothetical protein
MRIAAIIVFLALLATPAQAQYGIGTYHVGYLTPTITYPCYHRPYYRPYYRAYRHPYYAPSSSSWNSYDLRKIRFNLELMNDREMMRGW